MNTADLLMLSAFLFNILSGLTSASPVSSFSTTARSLSPESRVSMTPVVRRDEARLCHGLTDISWEYGNQTNQDYILADCEKLSQNFKNITDEQGNITQPCGGPQPPSEVPGDFALLGTAGNCSLYIMCLASDSRNEVTLDYGDITDIIQLGTGGLGTSSNPKNSSVLSVRASTECQGLETDWIVAFTSDKPVMKSPEGKLKKIVSDFIPAGEIQE